MTIEAIETLLLALTMSSTTYTYSTQTISNTSISPKDGASFICENLTNFKNYYNEIYDTKLEATGVENLIPLTIENEGKTFDGILIDFNDNKGYVTIGYDYELYDIVESGDQPFGKHTNDKPLFSTTCGYFYYDEDYSDWLSVVEDNNSIEKDWKNIELNKTYSGQEKDYTGNGKIEDASAYVNDKYGSGYKLDSYNSLNMNEAYTQWDLSVYKTVEKDSSTSSEGNCWMVSAYNVLNFLAQNYYQKMYKPNKIEYIAKDNEPNIYKKHFDDSGKCVKQITNSKGELVDKWILNNENSFPELYTEERSFVDDFYGKCDGGTTWQTENIINRMVKKYNYDTLLTNRTYFWGYYANTVPSKIDNNLPCIWSTSNDTYGAHSMTVCGYKYFKKTTGFWIFKSHKYKLFYELKDGHADDGKSRYFDVSGHVGFTCITFIDIKD